MYIACVCVVTVVLVDSTLAGFVLSYGFDFAILLYMLQHKLAFTIFHSPVRLY